MDYLNIEMGDNNSPRQTSGLLATATTKVTAITNSLPVLVSKLLGPESYLEERAEALIDFISNTVFRVKNTLPGKRNNHRATIESFLQGNQKDGAINISLEDISWPKGVKPSEYREAISQHWGVFLIYLLHKNMKSSPGGKLKGRRFSQSVRKKLKELVPQRIQDFTIRSYRTKDDGSMDFNDRLFYDEISASQDIFISTLNLILRVNILVDNKVLGEMIAELIKTERSYKGQESAAHFIELNRVAFLIQVLNSGLLQDMLSSQRLREVINVRIQGLKIESQCIIAGRQFDEDEASSGGEAPGLEPDYTQGYALSREIIEQFSNFYVALRPLKKRVKCMQMQREIIGNVLNIDVDEKLAVKVFDKDSPLYKLIFLGLLSVGDEKEVSYKFSSDFKTFLLRLISKFPKIPHSDESGNDFSYFYASFIHLHFNDSLDKKKKEKTLSFLNSIGNVGRNMDFCLLMILGDLEDISMMPYLNDTDRDFIEANFDIDVNNPRTEMTSGQALRELDYLDLCRMQTLSPSELEAALEDIKGVKTLFRKEQIRDLIAEDLGWIPKNMLGYSDLKQLIQEDIMNQDSQQLGERQKKTYAECEIGTFARTHRIILTESLSLEAREKSLQQIGLIYQALISCDNNLKRQLVHELFKLHEGEREVVIGFINNTEEGFDFAVLGGHLSDLVRFVKRHNYENEPLSVTWELYTEANSSTTNSNTVKNESDASIFIEVFGEELGLRIALLKLHDSIIDDLILTIGASLKSYHAVYFVEFIESKKIQLKGDKKQVSEKLRKILSFSVLIYNHSLHGMQDILKYYLEIWNLNESSSLLQEMSDMLEDTNVHNITGIEELIYSSLVAGDIKQLEKSIKGNGIPNISEVDKIVEPEGKIHIKLSSARPGEVVRKIKALGYVGIPTRSGHNKYRGLNKHGKKVMIILPLGKGDVNKYILQQIVGLTGLTTSEWEDL